MPVRILMRTRILVYMTDPSHFILEMPEVMEVLLEVVLEIYHQRVEMSLEEEI